VKQFEMTKTRSYRVGSRWRSAQSSLGGRESLCDRHRTSTPRAGPDRSQGICKRRRNSRLRFGGGQAPGRAATTLPVSGGQRIRSAGCERSRSAGRTAARARPGPTASTASCCGALSRATHRKWDCVRLVHSGGAAAKSTKIVAVGGATATLRTFPPYVQPSVKQAAR